MRYLLSTALPLALAATAPVASARAQTAGRLTIGAGSATDARGVRSNAMTVAPGLTVSNGSNAHLSLEAVGTFFQNDAWSAGGALTGDSRVDVGAGFGLALTADASATRTSYAAWFIEGNLTPLAEWSRNGFTLFGGGRVAAGHTAVTTTTRQLGPFPGTTTLVSATRTLTSPVYGARLRLLGDDPSLGGELSFRDEPMSVAGVRVTDRIVRAAVVSGPVTLAGSLGRRAAPDEHVTFGDASLEMALGPAVSLGVAGGRYASDRLTGAAGGNYVTAGLALRLGVRARTHLPVPPNVPAPPAGTTRLAIRAPGARRVEVAGDWNDWQPVPAIPAANGVWYADLRLTPGEYRYAFRIDGHAWRVPDGAVATRDGFGGQSAYVTVRGDEPTESHAPQEER